VVADDALGQGLDGRDGHFPPPGSGKGPSNIPLIVEFVPEGQDFLRVRAPEVSASLIRAFSFRAKVALDPDHRPARQVPVMVGLGPGGDPGVPAPEFQIYKGLELSSRQRDGEADQACGGGRGGNRPPPGNGSERFLALVPDQEIQTDGWSCPAQQVVVLLDRIPVVQEKTELAPLSWSMLRGESSARAGARCQRHGWAGDPAGRGNPGPVTGNHRQAGGSGGRSRGGKRGRPVQWPRSEGVSRSSKGVQGCSRLRWLSLPSAAQEGAVQVADDQGYFSVMDKNPAWDQSKKNTEKLSINTEVDSNFPLLSPIEGRRLSKKVG
jgi:hypothetical protein